MDTFPDLGALSDIELKDLIKELSEEEVEISYKRRICTARSTFCAPSWSTAYARSTTVARRSSQAPMCSSSPTSWLAADRRAQRRVLEGVNRRGRALH